MFGKVFDNFLVVGVDYDDVVYVWYYLCCIFYWFVMVKLVVVGVEVDCCIVYLVYVGFEGEVGVGWVFFEYYY